MPIYLDNCATTRPDDAVIKCMAEHMAQHYYNPHAFYREALENEKRIDQVSRLIAAATIPDADIIYTSGGTEADNLAILGYLGNRKGHIVTSKGEHPAVSEVFKRLAQSGWTVDEIGLGGNGTVKMDALREALRPDTLLVSVLHVSNETGAINDINGIKQMMNGICPSAVLHADGVQAFGHSRTERLAADMYALSAHKIHGPKGVGALAVRKGVKLQPIVYGGGQQNNLRSGTLNVAGILGLGKAAELALEADRTAIQALKERMWLKLSGALPDAGLNGPGIRDGAAHVMSVSFPGVRGETLLHLLEDEGILVSAGSACSSKKGKMNRVLSEMGMRDDRNAGSVRISFSRFNTLEEIDYAAERIVKLVKRMKR